MITRQVIDEIYKKYKKAPKLPADLDISLLFDDTAIHHDLLVDPEEGVLTIGSMPPESPFASIALDRIHGIVPFENWLAVVMHSSILFLNRHNDKTAIDIKTMQPTLGDRLRGILSRSVAL